MTEPVGGGSNPAAASAGAEPVSGADLGVFVSDPSDSIYLQSCVDEATEMITHFIGSKSVPESVVKRCVLEVAADLFHRRTARNGVIGFDGYEPAPIRINRDPMAAAYPLLRQYLPLGLG